ncbi:phage protein NinX family protein [Burkholderia vietnamiensis]|uniref:phage protein NinX family protein n=1 Tax=Burkholderia vietnamiensis TaxID=60552 RepID=UPI001B980CBE|nr:phage protein NinX family protein [Burkholderia vietnamiensis]MBR8054168.1 DUF2591 family protein [Burkholderia vietnamiensis]
MKVSELSGDRLDFWVCRAELGEFAGRRLDDVVIAAAKAKIGSSLPYWPSRSWLIGGPIIERNDYLLPYPTPPYRAHLGKYSAATPGGFEHSGDTPLIAAMRAYVASKFGDEVPDDEVPA